MVTTTRDPEACRTMEQRLSEIGRRVDDLMSKVRDGNGLRQTVSGEVDVWRQWRDELHLQAELASMEVRDAVQPTVAKVDLAFDRVLDRVDELLAATEFDAGDVRSSVEKEMKGLRRDLEAASAEFRIA